MLMLYLEPSPIVDDTLKALHSLLTSIPTFWGTGELGHVIRLYVDQCAFAANPHSAAMATLAKAIAKQVPMKTVIPVMYDMWPSLYTLVNQLFVTWLWCSPFESTGES
jgi:U3 small nucleolar RNA-associated protein 10